MAETRNRNKIKETIPGSEPVELSEGSKNRLKGLLDLIDSREITQEDLDIIMAEIKEVSRPDEVAFVLLNVARALQNLDPKLIERIDKLDALKNAPDFVKNALDEMGINSSESEPLSLEIYSDENNLTVMSHAIYQALREALAQNSFQRTADTPWPTAVLKKGGASGHAQLRPPILETTPMLPSEKVDAWAQLMWEQQKDLTDLDADALDLLSHIWLQQARTAKDYAIANVDQFLAMRGLEQKQKEQGRRAGYEIEQRQKMLQVLSHIQNIWLNLGEVELYEDNVKGRPRKSTRQTMQSRAFIITDRMGQMRLDGNLDIERFIFQPGHLFAQFLFGPGRQTALLSARAVQYDPYRQKWEKRLARYFSWQWRIQARSADFNRPYRVATLLEAVGEKLNPRRPNNTRERLEKALDTLQADGVISAWQYDRWDEEVAAQRGWGQLWTQATLLLEPPEVVREAYKSIERPKDKDKDKDKGTKGAKDDLKLLRAALLSAEKADNDVPLAARLQQKRKLTGLSQLEAADKLGIVQSYLSKLERSQVKPAPDLERRILHWLEE